MITKNIEQRGNYIQKIITDNIIFCKPRFDYKEFYEKKEKIIFIEREPNNKSANNYIPCMFHMNLNTNNFLICFHGNSEDIFTTEKFGLDFRDYIKMNILFVEYPGYSIYNDPYPEPKKIFDDSIIVYDWIKKVFHISDEQIFVLGRSLGTSPAIYLSSQRRPKALFLISAFTSIKNIGIDKHLSFLTEKIFNSILYIKNIQSHVLLMHGEKDKLININHSKILLDELNKYNPNHIVHLLPIPNMTHDISNINDIINPINQFLVICEININNTLNLGICQKEINDLFTIPDSINKILESKIFNIKEFVFSKSYKKNNAFLLIRLIDERIALSNNSFITIYNERRYQEDLEINVFKGMNKIGKINFMFQLKNENLICTTSNGYIFKFKVDIEEYEKLKDIYLNSPIYKIELMNSGDICLISDNFIKFYDSELNEILSVDNKNNFYNFIAIDDYLVFISDKQIYYYKFQRIEKHLEFLFNQKITIQCNNSYTLVNSYNSLILADKDSIYYFEFKENKLEKPKIIYSSLLDEKITFIHKIHDQLFLASTDHGYILQINFDDNNNIAIEKNLFEVDGKSNIRIESVLFKNLRNILVIGDNKMSVFYNSKRKGCIVF